jgi:SAM-dependent methyltransferase
MTDKNSPRKVMSCLICGQSKGWSLAIRLPRFLFKQKASVFSCKSCGVGRTEPPPSTSFEYYEQNDRNDKLFTDRSNLYKAFSRNLLELLRIENPHGLKLLDFGCGGGFVVEVAKELGFDAYGIEANMSMVSWCQERGLNVQSKSLESLIKEEKKFDIIIFSAVLEHIEDPIKILSQCKQIMLPNAIIVVSQAAYDGLLPKLFPWGWYGWQPQEHFWHFNKCSLDAMALRAGFRIQKVIRNSLYHPWFKKGSLLELVGRNFAALIARVGVVLRRGDNIIFIIR